MRETAERILKANPEFLFARNPRGSYGILKKATVGIAGAGGLGSTVALMLTRAGVGNLIIADFDVIELSNLNRQQYFPDQLGRAKVAALKENLERINPSVHILAHQVRVNEANTAEIYGNVQVLIEAFDKSKEKVKLLNNFAAVRPKTPLIMASGLGGYGANNKIRQKKLGRYLYMIGDFQTTPEHGLVAPRVGIVACCQANLAVEILLGKGRSGGRTRNACGKKGTVPAEDYPAYVFPPKSGG
jgi:sulfur carrier protein ThiS adenylyltransferase